MQIFKKKSNIVISYVLITFGLALFTFAWSTFMLPAKIISGGVTGISSIIHFLAPGNISIGILSFLINGVLLDGHVESGNGKKYSSGSKDPKAWKFK